MAKRVSRGVELHAAYTWGKSIDTLSATAADDAFPNGLFNQLFFDQRTTRGPSDFNVAQTLVLSLTWELPSADRSSRALTWAASGWQLGGLYKASSGQPFTPILGGDPAGQKLDETSQLPNRLAGPGCGTLTNPGNPNHYIKTECLGFPGANKWEIWVATALLVPGCRSSTFLYSRTIAFGASRRISMCSSGRNSSTFSTALTSPRRLTIRRSSIRVGNSFQAPGSSPPRKQLLVRFSLRSRSFGESVVCCTSDPDDFHVEGKQNSLLRTWH